MTSAKSTAAALHLRRLISLLHWAWTVKTDVPTAVVLASAALREQPPARGLQQQMLMQMPLPPSTAGVALLGELKWCRLMGWDGMRQQALARPVAAAKTTAGVAGEATGEVARRHRVEQ